MSRLAALTLAVMLLISCGRAPRPASEATPPSSETATLSPAASATVTETPTTSPAPRQVTRIVFVPWLVDDEDPDRFDVHLYDLASDRVRSITSDGERNRDQDPRFRSPSLVTYLTRADDGSVVVSQIDLESDARSTVLRAKSIIGIDWSPDGASFAWTDGSSVFIRRAADGQTESSPLPPRDPEFGRGGGADDEQRLTWSPRGDLLLVQDTARCCPGADDDDTIHVMRLDGRILASRKGTFARWSANGDAIYFRDIYVRGDAPIQELVVATGKTRTLPTSVKAFHIAASPDGRFLAYDDNTREPAVFLLDLRTGAERRIGPGVAPLWMSDDRLAAAKTRPCRQGTESCGGHGGPFWRGVGRSVVYSLDGETPREIALPTTWDTRAA